MSGSFKKEDLRVKKTYKSLTGAMLTLLTTRNFVKITVNDLCEKALVSRATFYTHFNDKYSLLKYWLIISKKEVITNIELFNGIETKMETIEIKMEAIETEVNRFLFLHSRPIKNIIENADSEVLDMLHEFMTCVVDVAMNKTVNSPKSCRYIITSNFMAGGLVYLLSLRTKNKLPADIHFMNKNMTQLMLNILEWHTKQELLSGEDV